VADFEIETLTRAALPEDWTELDSRAVDTVRVLAADAVQKVGNGHPGTAMSLAPPPEAVVDAARRSLASARNPANAEIVRM
jgi:transketolase